MDLEVPWAGPGMVLFPVLGALLHNWKTLFKGDHSSLPGNRESSRVWKRLFRHFGSFLTWPRMAPLQDRTGSSSSASPLANTRRYGNQVNCRVETRTPQPENRQIIGVIAARHLNRNDAPIRKAGELPSRNAHVRGGLVGI